MERELFDWWIGREGVLLLVDWWRGGSVIGGFV